MSPRLAAASIQTTIKHWLSGRRDEEQEPRPASRMEKTR